MIALLGELTLTGTLGGAVPLSDRVGLDVGLDMDWVDAPSISIPGVHVGLTVDGGVRRGSLSVSVAIHRLSGGCDERGDDPGRWKV